MVSQAYKLAWEREYLDLTELARLRWVEGSKVSRLADHFEISRTAVKERMRAAKKNPKRAEWEARVPSYFGALAQLASCSLRLGSHSNMIF